MKNAFIFGGISVLILAGGVWWSSTSEEKQLEEQIAGIEATNIISQDGVHWHPKLEIYVNGERQNVPSNIGIGPQHAKAPTYDPSMRMTAMHTHEPDGTIHLEFPRVVTNEDVKLKNFFSIWGKDFMEFGSSVTMTVNGEENTELGEYEMKDGDTIVLDYQN